MKAKSVMYWHIYNNWDHPEIILHSKTMLQLQQQWLLWFISKIGICDSAGRVHQLSNSYWSEADGCCVQLLFCSSCKEAEKSTCLGAEVKALSERHTPRLQANQVVLLGQFRQGCTGVARKKFGVLNFRGSIDFGHFKLL